MDQLDIIMVKLTKGKDRLCIWTSREEIVANSDNSFTRRGIIL